MAIKTTDLDLGNYISAGGVFEKQVQAGILSKLTEEAPEKILVGKTDVVVLSATPKAELVGEGGEKSNTGRKFGKREVRTYKVQFTERYSDEVLLQDEEAQVGVMDSFVGSALKALFRAVDLVAFHGINPHTGSVAAQAQHYVGETAGRIYAGADAAAAVEDAYDHLVAAGWSPSGIGIDPRFVSLLRKAVDASGNRVYPGLGLGTQIDNFEGLRAGVSNTVSASQETATGPAASTLGILGDFEALKYKIVRSVPVELIEHGDPDGEGDLKRQNEVALRAELYFAAATLADDSFVVLTNEETDALPDPDEDEEEGGEEGGESGT